MIWARSCWGQFLVETTETLLRFQCLLNLSKVLGKIWAGVMALTTRDYTRIDIGFRSDKVWNVKLIKSILTVVKKMKEFPNREIIFLINVIFKKQRTVLFIKLEIQNVINILNSITILSNNKLLRFLLLTKQKINDYVTQKGSIKYWMNLYECEKFKLNYQRIPFKDTFNQKKKNISII